MPENRNPSAASAYAKGFARGLRLHAKYRSRTMIPARDYADNLALVSVALRKRELLGGAIIECGTWRGGMSAGLIEIGGPQREYHFFDSFTGLPPATARDGEWAQVEQPHDNCRTTIEEFRQTISRAVCPSDRITIHPGLFDQTLREFSPPALAILRLDADWYESTMVCLEHLWDHVMVGGYILVDDYYSWEGCSRAVHAFLAKRDAKERILSGRVGRFAYIIRQA